MFLPVLKKISFPAALLFAAALLIRLWQIDLPTLEPYNSLSRQAIVASVARNFYQRDWNFFYPQIDENGHGPYLFNAEMPFTPYLMALGYAVAGGVKAWAARLVPVACSMISISFLYLWIRRRYGRPAALFGAAFFAFSPLSLGLSRALQPDAMMLASVLGALFFMDRYRTFGRERWFWASSVCAFLAVATKIQSAPLLLPAFVMLWSVQGPALFGRWKNWAYAAIALGSLPWYLAMWHAGRTLELAYLPFAFVHTRGPEGSGYWDLWAPLYLVRILKIFLLHILTPAGVLAAAVGAWSCWKKKDHAVAWWAFSMAVYVLGLWRILIDHGYYQYPLAAFLAVPVGVGSASLASTGGRFRRQIRALGFVALVCSVVTTAHYYRGIFSVPGNLAVTREAGEALDAVAPKDALVVAGYGGSNVQVYFCDRRGWTIDVRGRTAEDILSDLDRRRSQGASYYVQSQLSDLPNPPEFIAELKRRYVPIRIASNYVIFELKDRQRPEPTPHD